VTAVRNQLLVSVEDLRFATLRCRHCNTRVALDLDAEFEPRAGRAAFQCPTECPRCGNPFDSAIPAAVNSMQRVYKALAKLGDAVTFTGEPHSADGPGVL
jgi:hypothetical protein